MFQKNSVLKMLKFLTGSAALYAIYIQAGIIQESLIKDENEDAVTKIKNVLPFGLAHIAVTCFFSWILSSAIKCYGLNIQKVQVPKKKWIMCASMYLISIYGWTRAVHFSNFPLIMLIRSSNVLSVFFVTTIYLQFKGKQKFKGKIILPIFVTAGIVIFNKFGKIDNKSSSLLQILPLLIISFFAEGYGTYLIAQIKHSYKPNPLQIYHQINKWAIIVLYTAYILTNQYIEVFCYLIQHPLFLLKAAIYGLFLTFGALLAYLMIKQFKENVVKFLITIRMIVSVLVSILYYQHSINIAQMFGIVLIFGVVIAQFLDEKTSPQSNKWVKIQQQSSSEYSTKYLKLPEINIQDSHHNLE